MVTCLNTGTEMNESIKKMNLMTSLMISRPDELREFTANDEGKVFSEFYGRFKTPEGRSRPIPKFYSNPEDGGCGLKDDLRLEARALFLEGKRGDLLGTEELESFGALLDEQCNGNRNELIPYSTLKNVLRKTSTRVRGYFTAKLFCELGKGSVEGGVSGADIFTYATRKTWLGMTRIALSVYDSAGTGHLAEAEVQSFVEDLIPECPQLSGLDAALRPFYVCTVVTKFMFFLDTMRRGRIRIKDILNSKFLDDLLVLREEVPPEEAKEDNWFSLPSFLRVYGDYLNLDKDGNGMLSRDELRGFGLGTLNGVFVERVFQECLTYDDEMDFRSYLEFVLALESKQEPQALRYFFKIFDIDGKGYLDRLSLNYFFRGIQKKMEEYEQEAVRFEDINDELFDMVRPSDPTMITVNDLLSCNYPDYFVNILTDLNEFWNYENRELN